MNAPWKLNKWIIVTLHILFWVLLFSLPFLLQQYAKKNPQVHKGQPGWLFYPIKCLFWVAFFYINAYVVLPRFFYKRRYWIYGLGLFLLMAGNLAVELLYFLFTNSLSIFSFRGFIVFNTFPFLFILALSTAYKMFLDRIQDEKLANEKETEHLKTELSFLRSQISPHFMFNVLNGMVALARKKSDQLEPSLIKLSSILRYMLYENDVEKVSLLKEWEYMQSYIDLQQQRFGKNIRVNTTAEGIDGNYYIEPMLLIPFVENAFKHGTGLIPDAAIDISLKAKNGILQFTVSNRFNGHTEEIKDKTSGIGLGNVERRLNLLYKHTHSLMISKHEGWYTASLQLNLS